MLQVFYLDVAYVLQWFQVFLGVFISVSDVCFKYFICLQTYVVSVASGCFKSRLGVASPSSPSAASPRCLLLPALAGHPNQRRRRALPPSASRCWWRSRRHLPAWGARNRVQAQASGPDVRMLALPIICYRTFF
jgi:hypothetical protein